MNTDLTGTWKLLSYQRMHADGAITHPQGENPVGRISYDAAGRVSALMMRPARPGAGIHSTGEVRSADPGDLREMISGFTAYYGTYEIDAKDSAVTHHIQACLLPGWVGTCQRRKFERSGNQLVLSAQKADSTLRLVLEKEAE